MSKPQTQMLFFMSDSLGVINPAMFCYLIPTSEINCNYFFDIYDSN
jgi:hypothetical protein